MKTKSKEALFDEYESISRAIERFEMGILSICVTECSKEIDADWQDEIVQVLLEKREALREQILKA